DNADLRPGLEPRFYGGDATIGEEVDNLSALQITDDRAISLSALPRPVVDADDRRLNLSALEAPTHSSKQCVLADRHQKAARQAGRRTPTQRQPKVMYDRIQAGRTPGKCCSHIRRKAFNEDTRGAAGCGATKTPGDKSNPNRPAMRW